MIVLRILFAVIAFPCWLIVAAFDYGTLRIAGAIYGSSENVTFLSRGKLD
jgi:hypothetical protein